MSTGLHPLVVLTGPTASGKSALALRLAMAFHGEIVSCDALQVFRGMDIGTAKPTPLEREAVHHHLLDVRTPVEQFSAGDYQRDARRVLEEIRARGALPLVVGGTGLYLRALLAGLFEGPGRSDPLRRRLHAIADSGGLAHLHARLDRIDPAAAARIPPHDRSRVVRAYEVYLSSGRSLSWWQARGGSRLEGFRWLKLAVHWPRPDLYARIDARVDAMFAGGLVDEVRTLVARHGPGAAAFKAIGYREVLHHLEGRWTLADAIQAAKQASRRYAKRQCTWFRVEPDLDWIDGTGGLEAVYREAAARVTAFLEP